MSAIHYTRQGQGEPVVLIHGIGHHGQAWGEVTDLLAQEFDVVVVDLPGHGKSAAPQAPHTYQLSSVADQLEELFEELEIDRPHVVGNSLGGYLALELARRAAVVSATALSPHGFATQRELLTIATPQLLAMKAAACAPRRVLELFANKPALRSISLRSLYAHPERQTAARALDDSLNLRRARGFFPMLWNARGRQIGRDIPVPVVIAWGVRDRLLVPRQADRAARRLPQVTIERWPGCGHVPMIDDPDRVVRLVRRQVEASTVPA